MPDDALQSQLGKLRDLCGELARQVGPNTAGNADGIREILNKMDSLLLAHAAAEESTVYPRLLADGRPHVSELARRYQREMGGIKKAFADYSDKWSRRVIAAQPTIFRRETAALIAALYARIDREEHELFPLVAA